MQLPKAGNENKPHIGIYGRCNAGKSSLLNFIADAPVAIVSPQNGTTTDPVRKSYEILGIGPVVWIDTAGTDDTSALGVERTRKTYDTMALIDMALLVFRRWAAPEKELAACLAQRGIPTLPIHNAAAGDESPSQEIRQEIARLTGSELIVLRIAEHRTEERDELLSRIGRQLPEHAYRPPSLFGDRVSPNDTILLVCPIDSEAPAGRLILPQVQAIRDLLDHRCLAVVAGPEQIGTFFALGIRPKLVVTDSQIFPEVEALVPPGIEITSFSILLAAAKGDAALYREGLKKTDSLKEGDRILIAENCTHQVSCEDIGRSKIPRWLETYAGVRLRFDFVSGLAPLPSDLSSYSLMVQCGGCMATRSQIANRIRTAVAAGVPVTNYGMLIRKIRK